MGGFIFLVFIIIFVVSIINKIKETTDAGSTNNRKNGYSNGRQGGYNGQNYRSPNNRSQINNGQNYNSPNKKITYDWKPDYDWQKNPNQSNQGIQLKIDDRGKDTATSYEHTVVAPQSANTKAVPPAAGAKTIPQSANSKAIPSNASGKRESVAKNAKVANLAENAGTAATPVKNGVKTCAEVNHEMLKMLDPSMPGYKSFQYDASTYDVPESDAFKYSDVVVDSKVHVDMVPSYEEIRKNR